MEEIYIQVDQIVKEMNLELLYASENSMQRKITRAATNRPALPLTGYYEYFKNDAVQVFGKVEHKYLSGLSEDERTKSLDKLFSSDIPMLIICRNMEPFDECIQMAKKYDITLARTPDLTSDLIAALTSSLNVHLGPRTNVHGVFVEVYGEGILLLGDSGIGKSETAIELLKRGHRLVADDVVDIKRVSSKTLVGSAPEIIRYFVELRGIGIIDVRRIFGMGAVKPTEKVDLVINLEPWDDKQPYDRLGIDDETTDILGIKIPSLRMPVTPGRNLAIIIEVAAMNNRNKKMGHNSAKEFSDKLYASMLAKQSQNEKQ